MNMWNPTISQKFSPVVTNLQSVGPFSNHPREADICLKANDWRILKQKIERMAHGVWKTEEADDYIFWTL